MIVKIGHSSWVMFAGIVVLMFLIGCREQAETAGKKAEPVQTPAEPPVSFKTYSVMDSANLEKFFEFDEKYTMFSKEITKVIDDIERLSGKRYSSDILDIRKQIYYKVCYSDVDGFMIRHPCSLDSTLLVNIVRKFNYADSLKGVKVKLDLIAYSKSSDFLESSKMYLNEDGSIESMCSSKDGQKCDSLFVAAAVSKKLFPDIPFPEGGNYLVWTAPKQFKESIDKSSFVEKFEIDSFLTSRNEWLIERRYRKEERNSIIPFEMCYEDGFAKPCGISEELYSRVKESMERNNFKIVAVTFQRTLTVNEFAYGGMSSKHFCKSNDGSRCSELYALVYRHHDVKDLHGSFFALYRFDLNDFTFIQEDLGHEDLMPESEHDLYRKDGTFVAREKKLN